MESEEAASDQQESVENESGQGKRPHVAAGRPTDKRARAREYLMKAEGQGEGKLPVTFLALQWICAAF